MFFKKKKQASITIDPQSVIVSIFEPKSETIFDQFSITHNGVLLPDPTVIPFIKQAIEQLQQRKYDIDAKVPIDFFIDESYTKKVNLSEIDDQAGFLADKMNGLGNEKKYIQAYIEQLAQKNNLTQNEHVVDYRYDQNTEEMTLTIMPNTVIKEIMKLLREYNYTPTRLTAYNVVKK